MKAIVLYEHGGQDQLIYETDYRDPEIGPGDVLVRVKASSLNYHDVFTRRGMPGWSPTPATAAQSRLISPVVWRASSLSCFCCAVS